MTRTTDDKSPLVLALVTEAGWWIGLREIRESLRWGHDSRKRGQPWLYSVVRSLIASGHLECRGGGL